MSKPSHVLVHLSILTLAACTVAGCSADTDPTAPSPDEPVTNGAGAYADDPSSVDEAWEGPVPAEGQDAPAADDEHGLDIDVASDPAREAPSASEGVDLDLTPETIEDTKATPVFQLPFPCGQLWSGQTRTNHVPYRAVDFNRYADYGDTVVAAAGGRVRVVANYGTRGYGRWIEITHGNGWATRYAHLSVQAVRVGQTVARGQRIGNVGNTGGSTGAHLHYELLRYGTAVRAIFNGSYAYYFGTRSYRSRNCR